MKNNKKVAWLLILSICMALVPVNAAAASEITLYVDASAGKDGNGTQESPFANIEQAKQEIRRIKTEETTDAAFTVIFAGGTYPIHNTVEFTDADSGTEANPVVYKAADGEEVIFTGEQQIDVSKAQKVTDTKVRARLIPEAADKIVEIDLAAQGLTGYGYTEEMGFQNNPPAMTGLLQDGELLIRARYPNDDLMGIENIMYAGRIFKPDKISSNSDNWKHSKHDALLTGYLRYNWESKAVRVMGAEEGCIFTENNIGNISNGGLCYIQNLLEEIDVPGEYYIDSKTDKLYLYPKTPFTDSTELKLYGLTDTMISLNTTKYMRFENIIFECGQDIGVQMRQTRGVGLFGCTLRNFGKTAVWLTNTWEMAIQSCDIYNLGGGAIHLYTDEYSSLTPTENYIRNCEIHDYGKVNPVLSCALKGNGVGIYFGHNKVYNAPHSAVIMTAPLPGNQNIFEYNECFNLLTETADAGVFYLGGGLLGNGNILRYNYIHDIYRFSEKMAGRSAGFYLDDGMSGVTVYGNIMYNVNVGIQIGGGRYVTVKNNIVACEEKNSEVSIECEARTSDNWRNGIKNYYNQAMSMVDIFSPAWQAQYPEVQSYIEDDRHLPRNQNTTNNVVYKHKPMVVAPEVYEYGKVENNLETDEDIGFVDEANGNLNLREDSIVYKNIPDFQPIPFDRIGLYEDDYRKLD